MPCDPAPAVNDLNAVTLDESLRRHLRPWHRTAFATTMLTSMERTAIVIEAVGGAGVSSGRERLRSAR